MKDALSVSRQVTWFLDERIFFMSSLAVIQLCGYVKMYAGNYSRTQQSQLVLDYCVSPDLSPP
jgi:hypothetical protein